MKLYGGIEAGGTKFVCMLGSDPENLLAEKRFSTTSPDETIRTAIEFFEPYARSGELAAVGIASFGPVDLHMGSPTYGYITTTPKTGWKQVDLYGEIQRELNVPVAFDTDVNAAAFGEQYWMPNGRSLDPFIYITIGTGIGVGVMINGSPLHGLIHSEAGHIALPHDWQKDPFPGVCPFHGDCLEGLASGYSMRQRWGQNPEDLPNTHPAWDMEAEYIGIAIADLIYTYSPRRIILGGGVSQHPEFHETTRKKVRKYLNGYIQSPMVADQMDDYILAPALGNRSGGLGAIAMAIQLTVQMQLTTDSI